MRRLRPNIAAPLSTFSGKAAKAPDARPARYSSTTAETSRLGLARLRYEATFAAARDFEAGVHLQDLLVSAVVAILLKRLFL